MNLRGSAFLPPNFTSLHGLFFQRVRAHTEPVMPRFWHAYPMWAFPSQSHTQVANLTREKTSRLPPRQLLSSPRRDALKTRRPPMRATSGAVLHPFPTHAQQPHDCRWHPNPWRAWTRSPAPPSAAKDPLHPHPHPHPHLHPRERDRPRQVAPTTKNKRRRKRRRTSRWSAQRAARTSRTTGGNRWRNTGCDAAGTPCNDQQAFPLGIERNRRFTPPFITQRCAKPCCITG